MLLLGLLRTPSSLSVVTWGFCLHPSTLEPWPLGLPELANKNIGYPTTIWDILTLKTHSLFIWNSNSTGSPVIYLTALRTLLSAVLSVNFGVFPWGSQREPPSPQPHQCPLCIERPTDPASAWWVLLSQEVDAIRRQVPTMLAASYSFLISRDFTITFTISIINFPHCTLHLRRSFWWCYCLHGKARRKFNSVWWAASICWALSLQYGQSGHPCAHGFYLLLHVVSTHPLILWAASALSGMLLGSLMSCPTSKSGRHSLSDHTMLSWFLCCCFFQNLELLCFAQFVFHNVLTHNGYSTMHFPLH